MPRLQKLLTREDIIRAQKNTLSNRAAARYLHVSLPHYMKYAELYKADDGRTLYEVHFNRGGKGIPKYAISMTARARGRKEPPIMDILEGKVSAAHYDPQQLKYKLISMGLLEPKCCHCGFDEKRVLDGKVPLILRHVDGNKNNWNLDNLQFECYNCACLYGPNSVITEDMVERAEDSLDRNGPKLENSYELDDYQKEFLQELFHEKQYQPGEEFISRY